VTRFVGFVAWLILLLGLAAFSIVRATGSHSTDTAGQEASTESSIPIKHVVVIFMENHSFDNVLGNYCSLATGGRIHRDPCAGATMGKLPDGTARTLRSAADISPNVSHSIASQHKVINNGRMDGFPYIQGCTADTQYQCYATYTVRHGPCGLDGTASCIHNLVRLADHFAISDHTFEPRAAPSFGGHFFTVSPTLDGFTGDVPHYSRHTLVEGPGYGCDSDKDALWWSGERYMRVPSCVPDSAGNGPYRTSPVKYVPTLLTILDRAHESWKVYGGLGYGQRSVFKSGYHWTVCPTFYECLGHHRQRLVPADSIMTDASAGKLPAYSLVTPFVRVSTHNTQSMDRGDNWLGRIIGSIMRGPEWSSTAVFVTWDDCGCFYDHMNPYVYTRAWGLRVPMFIISPFAKPGYTDSRPATFVSMIAFVEHVFDLPAIHPCRIIGGAHCTDDVGAYDYMQAFDFNQTPLQPIPMVRTGLPPAEREYLKTHVPNRDLT
jgi:phospholipase C